MKTKTIKQTVTFNATPAEVYLLLMDAKKHAAFTGSAVKMSIKGEFEIFNGYCHGYNIEFEEGKKIVQAWHFNENGWPAEHFSICTFIFEFENDKTNLYFTQTDVPDNYYESLKNGWKEYYWDPMKAFLKSSKKH